MGKKGNIKLILPKNSGDKDLFDDVIQIIFKNDSKISSDDLKSKIATIMENKNVGVAPTSVIHKLAMCKYFGLIERERRSNLYYLTEFGINYAMSKTLNQQIDVIFDAIETVSFGRNNNGVPGSDSNVEPPIVFLKMLMDLETCSITELGCMLYYLEVQKIDYLIAISRIKNNTDISKERNKIKEEGGQKLFDPKFNLFFQSLKIIESVSKTQGYKLSSYIKRNYQNSINDLVILNSNEREKQIKNYQKTKNEKKNVNDLVSKFINTFDKKSGFTEPFINTIEKRVPSKIKKTKNINIGRNKKNNEMSDETKFAIGWRGEEYIYNLISNNKKILLDELDFSYNEKVKGINWFNFGFRDDPSWEDKSKGKGCDIEVQTNLRNIKIEVKTSWDNINYYTVTTNELISMDKNEENYFLTKINKFYNSVSNSAKPKLTVINNPITLLKNLDNIQTITLKN